MLNLSAIVAKTEKLLPERSSWLESMGLLLLGLGFFLGMATMTFDPSDYLANGDVRSRDVANLAGPVGAAVAGYILRTFGIVGITWPVVSLIWGTLVTLGFMIAPNIRRVLALIFLSIFAAAISEVHFSTTQLTRPVFGFGGSIGLKLGGPLRLHLGYGGSLVTLFVLAAMSLVLTGNLAVSRTASYTQIGALRLRGLGKSIWRRIMNRGADAEEMVKEALAAAAIATQVKKVKIQQAKDAGQSIKPEDISIKTEDLDQEAIKQVKKRLSKVVEQADADAEGAAGAGDASGKIDFYYSGPSSSRPTSKLFQRSTKRVSRAQDLEKIGAKLTAQLAEFKIEGKVRKITEGPVVTTFEFEPSAGTKVSKITAVADDLARMLQAKSLRILAPIPGKQVIGFEVPNAERSMIGFADLIDHDHFRSRKVELPVPIGLDTNGRPIIEDLAKMPHLLVAGSTGSGKSVFMNALIGGLICRYGAKDLRFIMIDPKMVELAAYNQIPHMAAPVVTDPVNDAKSKLEALVQEMEDRFNKMRMVGARNLQGFNDVIKNRRKSEFPEFKDKWQPMPFIVLIIDELADMMMTLGKEAEIPITRLAQKARAAGIHLVIATQRPSAEVVTGLIKANFPTRIAFRVLSALDSRTILDQQGAEKLLGQGDMLFLNAAGCRRIHGAYLNDAEVHAMAKEAGKIK